MGVFINFARCTERVLVKNFTNFWCVIGKKIFHEHGLRGPCNHVHGGARFSEKDFVSKTGNMDKKELKMGFFGFIENLIIFF